VGTKYQQLKSRGHSVGGGYANWWTCCVGFYLNQIPLVSRCSIIGFSWYERLDRGRRECNRSDWCRDYVASGVTVGTRNFSNIYRRYLSYITIIYISSLSGIIIKLHKRKRIYVFDTSNLIHQKNID